MAHQGRGLAVAGLALLGTLPLGLAQAFQVRSGDWTTSLDTTVSYGVSYRMEGQDDKLIARANGGSGSNSGLINSDDGNLNFRKGDLFSEMVKVVSEMDLRYQERHGVFIRGRAFYDFELEDDSRRHREISDGGLDEAGSSIDLLDAFVYGSWTVGERDLNARLGRQVINWGEGLFYQNGIGATNPVDINALRAPGSEVKEAYMPTFMVYGSYELRDNLTLEGYWQPGKAWEASKIDPCGTYFSTLDPLGEDCEYLSAAPLQEQITGRVGEALAFDSPAAAQAWANSLAPGLVNDLLRGYIPTTFIPRAQDIDGDDSAQYGLALRWYVPELNDTELGFYYLRYNMQVPMIGLTVGQPVVLPVVGALPDASSSRYYAEYLEKRDLFGISFNTSIGGESIFNGLSLAGELSYRPDTPIALGLNEYLPTALLNPDGLPVGTRLDGYREKDMFQASLAAIYNFNGLLGSDSAALFSELVASRVQGLESDVDYYEATSSAYGAQASLQLTYTNVFNLVNLVPSVGYQYSINGVAPQLTNGLDEEAQSWSVGLDAIYQESLTVGAKYVGYSGGGISNKRTDRDYLTFNVKYSF
ncbi:DUF1302 domain-containing protein [Aquipseudomonas alcaligenes]|uniref:Glycine/betaine transmethylase n=1 Tax=Aquipseudomonas alcaligenes TaxID=43263 RepID=A0AA37FKC7_AQUAC|nr:DUF1302 domain-containing protein [Pseudomonas alcaligenes]BCR26935.1 glycine/betaine transmethylase [Pseudomonas alcaligenes]GIZ65470.1 glycine/betaine transmethylase [Pseudomonas alcaligenes]GIZ69804.1 glycine/betaine transmethylase [Pseudomonas alcaligenes]GIZ74156.1 glycine/betaine transmethylase [Pseudomonas alcaligenes]GIZ78484.1 glycine/betaine transmethylase [Pseudomonas alcaligenes]